MNLLCLIEIQASSFSLSAYVDGILKSCNLIGFENERKFTISLTLHFGEYLRSSPKIFTVRITLPQPLFRKVSISSVVTKTPHKYIRATYMCIRVHTSNIRVHLKYIQVTYECMRVHTSDIRVQTSNIRVFTST